METVVWYNRPTGNLHLGNYFGAVKSFVKMQNEYNCYFFIADWHSLTTHPHPEISAEVSDDPGRISGLRYRSGKATIYIQSDVREVAELYLYLNMNAYLGELERVTSFKDKVRSQPNNVNASVTYPSLMAADIIIHKAVKYCSKDQSRIWRWPVSLPAVLIRSIMWGIS